MEILLLCHNRHNDLYDYYHASVFYQEEVALKLKEKPNLLLNCLKQL